jgi:hypothetical protein
VLTRIIADQADEGKTAGLMALEYRKTMEAVLSALKDPGANPWRSMLIVELDQALKKEF